jgi:hypothetical protein
MYQRQSLIADILLFQSTTTISAGRTMDPRNEESSINTDAEVEREQSPVMLQNDTASEDANSMSKASCKLKLFE